jgi:ankyrin repeat protein
MSAVLGLNNRPFSILGKEIKMKKITFNVILYAIILTLTACGSSPPSQPNRENDERLLTAAQNGREAEVRRLLAEGVDINRRAFFFFFLTALMYATLEGHFGIVKILTEHGANLDLQTTRGDGSSALMFAVSNGRADIVKYLLEQEADIDLRTGKGDTALTIAVAYRRISIVKYLVERGANLNARNNDGNSAIGIAYNMGEMDLYNYLKEQGAIEF